MKDLKLKFGDLDLIMGKDIGMVNDLDAISTLVQTIVMGNDDMFTKRLTDILNRTSVRKLRPVEIADIIQEEIQNRLLQNNVLSTLYLKTEVELDSESSTLKVNVFLKDDQTFSKLLEWVGDIYDGGYHMEFAEPVKRRW